jgi:hypothetical protein
MKKSLLALSLVTPMLAGSALAFPTGRNFDVEVEDNDVGTINARNRVVDNGSSCTYTLQWTLSSPPLSRTVRCDIRERKASNAFDCNDNARRWVTTLVERSGSCYGFDEFGQQTRISTLIAGESRNGLDGVFFASSVGDLQSFHVDN